MTWFLLIQPHSSKKKKNRSILAVKCHVTKGYQQGFLRCRAS